MCREKAKEKGEPLTEEELIKYQDMKNTLKQLMIEGNRFNLRMRYFRKFILKLFYDEALLY